jgi:hypothetical protein
MIFKVVPLEIGCMAFQSPFRVDMGFCLGD